MADRKITELSAMSAGGQATGDLLTIVDVSEAAAADKNKKMTMENLFKGIPGDVGIGTSSPAGNLQISGGGDRSLLITGGTSGTTSVQMGDSSDADAGAILYDNSNNSMQFKTNASEQIRIDSSGRLLVGTSTARAVGGESNPRLHIEGVGASSNSWVNISRYASSSGGPAIQLAKSRGASGGSYTVVQSGDTLGTLGFLGSDGTDLANYGAQIRGQVDGTPGSNSIPGRLIFSTTADSESSPTERLRISSEGKISTGGESSPDCNAGGLCLDQNAGDGIILSFKSSDINHGVTNFDQTDTYFSARKVSGAKGGLKLRAYTDAAGGDPAFFFQGIINSDADSSYVPFVFQGSKASGVTITNIAADRKIIDIRDSAGTSLASFTGTGLAFNGDTAAANALDDYEEGTWVATLNPSSGFTPTSNTTTGYYTKIGRQVTVITNAIMTIPSSLGSYVNNSTSFGLAVSGLPFTIANAGSQGRSAPVIGVADNIGFSGGYLTGHGSNNTTQCSIFVNKDNGAVRSSPTLTVSQSVNFHFCFTYFI